MKKKILTRKNNIESIKIARKVKNDEFYTPLDIIEDELKYYKDEFNGKDIICPCDWNIENDIYSITFINNNGIIECKVNSAYINPNCFLPSYVQKDIDFEYGLSLIKKNKCCNFILYLLNIMLSTSIKSVTASGYNFTTDIIGIGFENIDYSKYDICITNPPFSKYTSFISLMIKYKEKKDFNFIVLSSFLSRVTPCIGIPLMLNQCYLGYGRSLRIHFDNTEENKSVACDWLTSYPYAQDIINNEHIIYDVKFEDYKDKFIVMENMTMKDGTHPLKIPNQNIIPDDYDGWLFGSIGVLNKLSFTDFEWYGTHFKKYFNQTNIELNPFNHNIVDSMMKNNGDEKEYFHGIVFKRKKVK